MLLAMVSLVQGKMLGGWYEDGLHQFFPSSVSASHNDDKARHAIDTTKADVFKSNSWMGDKSESSWLMCDLTWPDNLGEITLNLRKVKIVWDSTQGVEFMIETKGKEGAWKEVYRGKTDDTDNNLEGYVVEADSVRFLRVVIPDGGRPRIRYIQGFGTVTDDSKEFVHPGMTTTADVAKIKDLVTRGIEPNKKAFEELSEEQKSRKDYSASPEAEIKWTAILTDKRQVRFGTDCTAAYYQGLMWAITGEKEYAENVLAIMKAWNSTLKQTSGNNSLVSFGTIINIAQAIELVKYSYDGWDGEIEKNFLGLLEEHVVPYMEARYFGFNNWTSQHNKAIMALAVLRNDRYQFNRAVERMKQVIDDAEEYGGTHELLSRDWNHALMHVGSIAEGAEVAWNQGVDLYSYRDNHIATIFNYYAWIDLEGGDPSKGTYTDPGGIVRWQGPAKKPGRVVEAGLGKSIGPFSWENVYNHYSNRVGVSTPKLTEKMEAHRAAGHTDGYTHHYGWGSLIDANVGEKAGE